MSTIEDVAKLAGLSRTTVSRVINNHPYVSDEKKKRVQLAMKHLGFVPNSAKEEDFENKKRRQLQFSFQELQILFSVDLLKQLRLSLLNININ